MAVSDDVRKALRDTNERFCREVLGKGKFDAIDEAYTAGARILPPGAPIMEGREAIKGFCGRGLRNKIEAAQSVALPSRALSKACSLWRKPTRFLEYPELELSNSLAGKHMRPVALGRKKLDPHRQPQPGQKVPALLSVVESCRRLKLSLRDYLAAARTC
jgi:hypothetical protein